MTEDVCVSAMREQLTAPLADARDLHALRESSRGRVKRDGETYRFEA